MTLYWTRSKTEIPAGFRIAVVDALDIEAADLFFGPHVGEISRCESPAYEEMAKSFGPGLVWFHDTDRLPSAYDRFRFGNRYDFQAMEDAGYDVD